MVHALLSCLSAYLLEISIKWSTPGCKGHFSSQVQVLFIPIALFYTTFTQSRGFKVWKHCQQVNKTHWYACAKSVYSKSTCKYQHHIDPICHCDISPYQPHKKLAELWPSKTPSLEKLNGWKWMKYGSAYRKAHNNGRFASTIAEGPALGTIKGSKTPSVSSFLLSAS